MKKIGLFVASAASLWIISGVALAAGVSDADRSFLTKDIQGARYELALAKVGEAKASSPQVRSYSQMVVHDHERANAALLRLSTEEGVQAPSGMTSRDEQMLAKLKGMTGGAFDKAYIDEVTRINAQDETDSKKEMTSTRDPKISAYIQKFAAMDAKHKDMGEKLKATIG